MSDPLTVHSLTEASLYLALLRCPVCGALVVPQVGRESIDAADVLAVPTVCQSCGQPGETRVDVGSVAADERAGGFAAVAAAAEAGRAMPVNPSGSPSRVIDVAGWLTLHARIAEAARLKLEAAENAADRRFARQLSIQAGECLDEALRFYDADEHLPSEDAFFTQAGRRQFREHPESFLRERLISLRAKLPR